MKSFYKYKLALRNKDYKNAKSYLLDTVIEGEPEYADIAEMNRVLPEIERLHDLAKILYFENDPIASEIIFTQCLKLDDEMNIHNRYDYAQFLISNNIDKEKGIKICKAAMDYVREKPLDMTLEENQKIKTYMLSLGEEILAGKTPISGL